MLQLFMEFAKQCDTICKSGCLNGLIVVLWKCCLFVFLRQYRNGWPVVFHLSASPRSKSWFLPPFTKVRRGSHCLHSRSLAQRVPTFGSYERLLSRFNRAKRRYHWWTREQYRGDKIVDDLLRASVFLLGSFFLMVMQKIIIDHFHNLSNLNILLCPS